MVALLKAEKVGQWEGVLAERKVVYSGMAAKNRRQEFKWVTGKTTVSM